MNTLFLFTVHFSFKKTTTFFDFMDEELVLETTSET